MAFSFAQFFADMHFEFDENSLATFVCDRLKMVRVIGYVYNEYKKLPVELRGVRLSGRSQKQHKNGYIIYIMLS
jgi:hypothetical protein